MKNAPEIVEALQVPETGTVRPRQPDLLGQVCDLPVVPYIVVAPEPGIFRIGHDEQIENSRQRGQRDDGRQPRRGKGFGRWFARLRSGLAVEFFLVSEQLQADAASSATCSWARATSSTARSRTSMCRSQSNRRAHSKARSPVRWFSSRESSRRVMPAA